MREYQGVLVESIGGREGDSEYTIVENLGDVASRTSGPTAALPLLGEEEGERAVASMEDQWQQEMNVFEVRHCALNQFSLTWPSSCLRSLYRGLLSHALHIYLSSKTTCGDQVGQGLGRKKTALILVLKFIDLDQHLRTFQLCIWHTYVSIFEAINISLFSCSHM
jgi:hypothetical protein